MKILVQDHDGVRPLVEGYASEAELQEFLREYADLIPLEEIDLSSPPLLCIGWEVGVTSESEDLLYVDPDGLLTMVETKLRKNPEARREVVGQVLEYAAHMSAWSLTDVEAHAARFFSAARCPTEYRGLTLREAMRLFTESKGLPEFSPELFEGQIRANIEKGRFRLIIAIDDRPAPLLKTVEFVNRFSERFEMFLIQLKRFTDAAAEQNVFVPALFGRVASSPARRRQEREWTWDDYVQEKDWPPEAAAKGKLFQARLMHVSQEWSPEERFHTGYTAIQCLGKGCFGVGNDSRMGAEMWFSVPGNPLGALPRGVTSRRTRTLLCLSGELDRITDVELRKLCEAALRQAGVTLP